jgi:hypothetical protein
VLGLVQVPVRGPQEMCPQQYMALLSTNHFVSIKHEGNGVFDKYLSDVGDENACAGRTL